MIIAVTPHMATANFRSQASTINQQKASSFHHACMRYLRDNLNCQLETYEGPDGVFDGYTGSQVVFNDVMPATAACNLQPIVKTRSLHATLWYPLSSKGRLKVGLTNHAMIGLTNERRKYKR